MTSLSAAKIVLLGDPNVGKTSLMRRLCNDRFDETLPATVAVDFYNHLVQAGEYTIKLSLWDVAGEEQYKVVRESFYRGSQAAILVYDLSNRETLLQLPRWVEEIHAAIPDILLTVAGNKSDLPSEEAANEGRSFSAIIQAPFHLTSAKTGEGVNDLFTLLGQLCLERKQSKTSQSE